MVILPLFGEDSYYSHVMKSVNIAELKNRLSAYLDEVKGGAEIIVRDRNTPVARIVPFVRAEDDDAELRALAARGRIRLGERPLDEAFWKLPAPRVNARALKRALERERDEA
jgi:prevent-host-death family protein